MPQIPGKIISTYELPINGIVSSDPNRLIVFEGAEERLQYLSVSILERLMVVTGGSWQLPLTITASIS